MIKSNSIEQLKGNLSIREIVSKEVDLDKKGFGPCPFHNEKSASFHINERENYFKCFGCGEAGDAISFVQKVKGLSFAEAIEEIAKQVGFQLEYEEVSPEVAQERERVKSEKEMLLEFNNWFLGKLKNQLLESAEAQAYLLKRKYTLDEALSFDMGYAPDSFNWIKELAIAEGKLPQALKLGIVSENDKGKMYDYFRNRIMFPVKNHLGQVLGFSGRFIGADNGKSPKYLNSRESALYSKETTLFGIERAHKYIIKSREVFLVEGMFDVNTCHKHNWMDVVASSGTAITKHQLSFLKKYCDKIYILTDNDNAGKNAMLKAVDLAAELGFQVYSCSIKGEEKDIDELLSQ
jgi:DNA primase